MPQQQRTSRLLIEIETLGARAAATRLGAVNTQATRLERNNTKLSVSSKTLNTGLGNTARNATATGNTLGGLSTRALATTAAFIALGASLVRFGSQASQINLEFGRNVAEVLTLLEGTEAQLRTVTEESLRLASTFGGTATQQVQAFYAAFSAGASSFSEATDLVTRANQLAIGGVATLEASISVLTGTMNAYSQTGIQAAEVSDLLFVAVRNGVTTIPQLSMSLAAVTATAANFGVAFGTVTASIAGLTASGTVTRQATTQINSLILSLQRFTPETRAFARELGLSSTAAQDYGQVIQELAGILAETESQSERTAILFRLFGSEVEALRAAASLTGGGFETFARTLRDNANASGAASEAYERVANTLDNRLRVAQGQINAQQVRFGEQLNKLLVPAYEAWARVLEVVGNNIRTVGIIIGAFVGLVIPPLIAGLWSAVAATTALTGGLNLIAAALVSSGIGAYLSYAQTLQDTRFSVDDLREAEDKLRQARRTGSRAEIEAARRDLGEQIRILRVQSEEADEARDRARQRLEGRRGDSAAGIFSRGQDTVRSFLGLEDRDAADVRRLQETTVESSRLSTQLQSLERDYASLNTRAGFYTQTTKTVTAASFDLTEGTRDLIRLLDSGFQDTDVLRSSTKQFQAQLDVIDENILSTELLITRLQALSLVTGADFTVDPAQLEKALAQLEAFQSERILIIEKFEEFEERRQMRAAERAAEAAARQEEAEARRRLADQERRDQRLLRQSMEYVTALEAILVGGVTSVGDLLGDALTGQIDTWRDFGESLLDIARNTVAGIIAQFTSQRLLGALGFATQGVGGAGQTATGTAAANLFGGAGGAAAIGSGGGTIFTSAGAGVAGTGASVFAAIAAPLAIIAGGALILNELLSERTVSDTNTLRVDASGNVTGENTTVTRRGSLSALFNGRYRTEREALEAEVTGPFAEAFSTVRTSVVEQAALIGGTVSSFAANLGNVDLNNTEAVLNAYASSLIGNIDGLESLTTASGGASAALTRVVDSFVSFNRTLELTGGSAIMLTPSLALLNSRIAGIIDTAQGTTDANGNVIAGSGIQAGLQGIFSFRSDAQQREEIASQIRDALGDTFTGGDFRGVPDSLADVASRYDELIAIAGDESRSDASRAGFLVSAQQLLSTDTQALLREFFRLSPEDVEETEGTAGIGRRATLSSDRFANLAEQRLAESLASNEAAEQHRELIAEIGTLREAIRTGDTSLLEAANTSNEIAERAAAGEEPQPVTFDGVGF